MNKARCCCEGMVVCDDCLGGIGPEIFEVVFDGFGNDHCSGGSDLNGTYPLVNLNIGGGDPFGGCIWEYEFDPSELPNLQLALAGFGGTVICHTWSTMFSPYARIRLVPFFVGGDGFIRVTVLWQAQNGFGDLFSESHSFLYQLVGSKIDCLNVSGLSIPWESASEFPSDGQLAIDSGSATCLATAM